MNNLDDIAVLVLRDDATEAEYADAVVELASEIGLLDGRDPDVLRSFLLSEKGKTWLRQKLVPVHLSTLLSTEQRMEASA